MQLEILRIYMCVNIIPHDTLTDTNYLAYS
jgi:hypothetical protein